MRTGFSTMFMGLLAMLGGCKGPASEAAPTTSASASGGAANRRPAPAAEKAKASDTGPIKVGILHSLSGTMAISETC